MTLRYAERTKAITNCIKQNVLTPASIAAECASLRTENKLLKQTMLNLRNRISLLEVDRRDGSVYSTDSFENLQAFKDDLFITISGETAASSTSGVSRVTVTDVNFDGLVEEDIVSLERLNHTLSESSSIILRSKGSLLDKINTLDHDERQPKADQIIVGEQRIARALKAENDKLRKDNKDIMDSKFATEGEARHLQHVMVSVRGEIKEAEAKRDALRDEVSRMEERIKRSQTEMFSRRHRRQRYAPPTQDIEMSVIPRKPEMMTMQSKDEELLFSEDHPQVKMRQSQDNLDSNRARLYELETREVTFRADIRKLQDDLANEHALRMRFAERLVNVSTESECLQNECNKLRADAAIQQEEKENMLGSLQAKEALIAELREELRKSQAKISETEDAHEKAGVAEEDTNDSFSDSASRDSSLWFSRLQVPLNPSHQLGSTHTDIRIHAAKMLHFANRAIEKGRSNRTNVGSVASSLASEFKPESTKDFASLVNSYKHPRAVPSLGKPPLPGRPTSGPSDNPQVIICNMENVDDSSPWCICQDSLFSGNGEHIEFYLPKLGLACSCGNHKKEMPTLDGPDPTALSNILRPWQVEFLSTLNLRNGVDLVHAYNQRGEELARAMRKWRKENELPSVKTKSCGIALHIWSTTCKAVVKSVRKEKCRGATVFTRPEFLELTSNGDGRTVSTLGYGSIIGMHADFLEV